MKLTRKQKAAADRELTSKTCAGCGGTKARGAAFCSTNCMPKVKRMIKEASIHQAIPLFVNFYKWYHTALHFLLEGCLPE